MSQNGSRVKDRALKVFEKAKAFFFCFWDGILGTGDILVPLFLPEKTLI